MSGLVSEISIRAFVQDKVNIHDEPCGCPTGPARLGLCRTPVPAALLPARPPAPCQGCPSMPCTQNYPAYRYSSVSKRNSKNYFCNSCELKVRFVLTTTAYERLIIIFKTCVYQCFPMSRVYVIFTPCEW